MGAYGIGLFNATIELNEKGFYAMAYTLSLFAAITVQKNVRDKMLIDELDEVQTPYVSKELQLEV